MKLSMVSIEKGGVILVAAEGHITAGDVDPAQKNPFETLLGVTWAGNRVLLNMEKSPYIDSSAIGWLMSSHKVFKDNGGALVMYNVQPAVRQLLDILKLSKVIVIAENEAAAREQIGLSANTTSASKAGGVR
jgi:anti-anti-sigma factor